MEGIHINDLDESEELEMTPEQLHYLLLLLVLVVHLAIELDSNASGHVVNTLAPDVLVDGGCTWPSERTCGSRPCSEGLFS